MTYGYVADIFAAFQAPSFWIERLGQNWLVWNPNIYVEGSVTGELTFKSPLVNMIMKLHLVGFKIAPLDYSLSFSLDNSGTRCSSLSLFREVFDAKLELEFYVNECSVGLAGFFLRDNSN